jgi:hypothetical protein
MSILFAIGKSHKGRHARSLRVAMVSDTMPDALRDVSPGVLPDSAREEGTGPIVGEWNGSEVRRSRRGPREGRCAGKHVKAAAPHELDLNVSFGHELQAAMRRQRRALPQFR